MPTPQQELLDAADKLVDHDLFKIALLLACFDFASVECPGKTVQQLETLAEEAAQIYLDRASILFKEIAKKL